jgi:hypothetical protein
MLTLIHAVLVVGVTLTVALPSILSALAIKFDAFPFTVTKEDTLATQHRYCT